MENHNKKRKLNILSFLIILIFSKSVSQDLSDSSIYSYVIMNITEGTNKIYYDQSSSFTKPDEVYVNGIIQENKAFQVFNKDENNATLIWRHPITSCAEMFRDCGHIIEMDFSHFNISQVTKTIRMFNNCKMLKSLNLSNFSIYKINGNEI